MESYLQYAHNLSGGSDFEKFGQHIKSAIAYNFVRQIHGYNALQKDVLHEAGKDVFNFISKHLDLFKYHKSIIFTTDHSSYVDDVDFENVHAIVNLRKANHIKNLDALFQAVNSLLPKRGMYIGRLETCNDRKTRILRKFGNRLGHFFWLADFMLNRIIPRIPYLENIYHFITKGQSHELSDAEIMGRLVYSGFEIIEMKSVSQFTYFVAIKAGKPLQHKHPSFYPIIKLNRIGKDGHKIGVYKMRTMHPYSEYLQDYIIKRNGYNNKGKPANDFRVTRWGKFMRKLWIDELPQIINVLKGEMKLVGVRPLSEVRFNEFPDDLKRERIRFKPGCIPPYVALNMSDDKLNIEAERIYLEDLKKHPYSTDIRYFLMALYNILTNRIRSS